MKVKKEIFILIPSYFYGESKMVMADREVYDTLEDAQKSMNEHLQAGGYAYSSEDYDGTFEGRTFEEKIVIGNNCGTIERITDVPEEYYFKRVEIFRETIEIDVPLVFDIKDIKRIQLFTD